MFNLTAPTTPVTCGPCEWLPPMVALVIPITQFGSASFSYSLPCTPTLVGVQFQTQWTTVDPVTMPCAPHPGIAMSDRHLHTIGQ